MLSMVIVLSMRVGFEKTIFKGDFYMYDSKTTSSANKLIGYITKFSKEHPDKFSDILKLINVKVSSDGEIELYDDSFSMIAQMLINSTHALTKEQIDLILKFKKYFLDVLIQIHLEEMSQMHDAINSIREENFIQATAPIYSTQTKLTAIENSLQMDKQTKSTSLFQVYNDLQNSIENLRLLITLYIKEIYELDICKNPFKLAAQVSKIKEIMAKVERTKRGFELYEQSVNLCECIEKKLKSHSDTMEKYNQSLKALLTKENCNALSNFDKNKDDGFWKKWQNKLIEANTVQDILEDLDFDNIVD